MASPFQQQQPISRSSGPSPLLTSGAWKEVDPSLFEPFDSDNNNVAQKKRMTVIAMIDAKMAGEPIDSIFRLPYTCNRTTYYKKNGWKYDPVFQKVLEEAGRAAMRFQGAVQQRSVYNTVKLMMLRAPAALAKMTELMNGDDDALAYKSSEFVLKNIGIEEMVKAEMDHVIEDHAQENSMEDWAEYQKQTQDDIDETMTMFDGIDDEAELAASMMTVEGDAREAK